MIENLFDVLVLQDEDPEDAFRESHIPFDPTDRVRRSVEVGQVVDTLPAPLDLVSQLAIRPALRINEFRRVFLHHLLDVLLEPRPVPTGEVRVEEEKSFVESQVCVPPWLVEYPCPGIIVSIRAPSPEHRQRSPMSALAHSSGRLKRFMATSSPSASQTPRLAAAKRAARPSASRVCGSAFSST